MYSREIKNSLGKIPSSWLVLVWGSYLLTFVGWVGVKLNFVCSVRSTWSCRCPFRESRRACPLSLNSGHSGCAFFGRCGVGESHAQVHPEAPEGARGGHAEGIPRGRRLVETAQGELAARAPEEPTGAGGMRPDP